MISLLFNYINLDLKTLGFLMSSPTFSTVANMMLKFKQLCQSKKKIRYFIFYQYIFQL